MALQVPPPPTPSAARRAQLWPASPVPSPAALTLPGKGPGRSSFRACLFSSTRRALQFSHQTPRSDPGEEPPPLPEPGEPVPKPGEPPREPGELVPMPGEAGPGEPVKELGDEVPEPGDGVPDEPSAEPAPSGVGRLPARDSSYAFRYQLSGEKGAAGLVGEQTSFTCRGDTRVSGAAGLPRPGPGPPSRLPGDLRVLPNLVTSDEPWLALGLALSICTWGQQDLLQQGVTHPEKFTSQQLTTPTLTLHSTWELPGSVREWVRIGVGTWRSREHMCSGDPIFRVTPMPPWSRT